jgi:hypothetical protein
LSAMVSFITRKKTFGIFLAGILLLLLAVYAILSIRFSSDSVLFNAFTLGKYLSTHGQQAFLSSDGWISYRPGLHKILKPWKHADKSIKAFCGLNDTLSKLGIQLLVVPVPDKETIIQSHTPFVAGTASNQRKRLIEKLAEKNISVIDLAPLFFAHRDQGRLYRKNDTHWDQGGISLAAEIAASRITALPADRPFSKYFLKDTVVAEQGDLSKMIRDSTLYSRQCTMVMTSDSVHFVDSFTSAVMIFGDSYTNTNKKYGAGFGAWIAYFTKQPNFTYTNLRANDIGPRLLLSFLENHKPLPRVIVWVFASRYLCDEIEAF